MTNQETGREAIVVGGGLAGLTAATLLARAGARVTLYERSTTLGGRAITQNEAGFLLNLGPHALYRAGAALRQLQLALAKNVTYVDGGWQTLVDGLRHAAAAAGVRVVAGRRITRIEHDGAVRRFLWGLCYRLTGSAADADDLVQETF